MTNFNDPDASMFDGVTLNMFGDADISTSNMIEEPVSFVRSGKREMRRLTRKANAADVFTAVPAIGSSLHLVTNGGFDYWEAVPCLTGHLRAVDSSPVVLHACTWILNREIAVQMLEMVDSGAIERYTLVTGDYFRQRTPDAYGIIAEESLKRGMIFRTAKVHAKVALIEHRATETYLSIESSGNFTNNTNIEQMVVTNDRALYEFHREWIEQIAGVQRG